MVDGRELTTGRKSYVRPLTSTVVHSPMRSPSPIPTSFRLYASARYGSTASTKIDMPPTGNERKLAYWTMASVLFALIASRSEPIGAQGYSCDVGGVTRRGVQS